MFEPTPPPDFWQSDEIADEYKDIYLLACEALFGGAATLEEDSSVEDRDVPPDYAFLLELDPENQTELARIRRRSKYADSYLNDGKPIKIGPNCRDLFPWLAVDTYDYETILGSVELREIIASTTMAVLDDADTITTVVGEDTSGRIPALVIGQAVNLARGYGGQRPARRLFLSGQISQDHDPAFRALGTDDRAVLVTEYVLMGHSANRSLDALRRAGYYRPSLATLDRAGGYEDSEAIITADTMYMGDRRSYTKEADFYLHDSSIEYKGVYKIYGDAHAKAALLDSSERGNLVAMRADIAHLAEEIVGIWYAWRQET